MAYCVRCGAYIPDGQSVCLACGYDPEEAQLAQQKNAEKNSKTNTAGTNAARQYGSKASNEELRRRLEEQRKRSQEQNRQWAEQERQRREEQATMEETRRQKQEENRQWAEEEYQRRQEEQQRTRASSNSDGTYRRSYRSASSREGNKALAALSYMSVLFALPYIFTPEDEFAKYHAKQGLKLFIFGIIADIAGAMIGVGWVITLVRLYLMFKGMSNALNGIRAPLPWIGTIGEK